MTPITLGVDDFAFAKHQSYGTILVDLDQSRPIALLSNREAQTLAQWLRQHPGVEVLSRDRSTTYRSGMSQGAPHAIQVADRFHLLQNLAEVLEQALAGQAEALKRVARSQRSAPDASQESETSIYPISPSSSVEQLSQQRRAQRLRNYEQVWQLHQQGWSTGVIAQKVGESRRSVQRYLLSNQFPERQAASHQGRSMLKPYKHYLLEQWNQGRTRIKTLFSEIQHQGYTGSYTTVARYVRRLAQAQGIAVRRYPTGRQLPTGVWTNPKNTLSAAFCVLEITLPIAENRI